MTEHEETNLDPHWNYRVIRRTYKVLGETEDRYAVHEVYYEGEKPRMCSVEPDAPHGMTLDELRQDLQWQLEALDKPVLDYEKDFPTAEEDGD